VSRCIDTETPVPDKQRWCVDELISAGPGPDKQDKCDNEIIFCSNTAKNTFYLTNNRDKYVHEIVSEKPTETISNVLKTQKMFTNLLRGDIP